MVRYLRPDGDDRVFGAECDRLYLVQWDPRLGPHRNFIFRAGRGDRVAQGVIGCDPPDRDFKDPKTSLWT